MAAAPTRPRVVVDIDPVEKKRLKALADENERSVAAEIRLAIRDYLDKHARRSR